MTSPAAALSWELWGRYRWGLSAFGAYLLAFAAVTATVTPDEPRKFALLGSVWFGVGLCYLIVVLAHGGEVRVEAADSGFPARAFVLPVRTSMLVGWPMLQGMLAAVVAWTAWDRLVLRPWGVETSFWWTPMLAAVVVTTQALIWMPFGLPWLRLPVAVVVLTALVRAPAFLALADERVADPDTENVVLSLLAAAVIPVAFVLARAGVGRARRGDGPDWLRAARSFRRSDAPPRERPPFRSAARALVWYEWRLRGQGFPLLVLVTVAVLMPCVGLLEPDDERRAAFGVTFLCVPVLLAGFSSSFMGATGDSFSALFVLPVSAATRPVGSAAVVAAKLAAAALAAAAAWGAAVALTAGWLVFTGGVRDLPREWDQLVTQIGAARAAGFAVLFAVGPPLIVWRLLVGDMWVGLTGRVWVTHAQSAVVGAVALTALYEVSSWKDDPARYARVADALAWAAGAAVAVKLLAAGWLLRVFVRRGEVRPATAWRLAGAWALAAALLFGVLDWLVPAGVVPAYALALGVVLFLPLTRLTAAPLALAWNRHR